MISRRNFLRGCAVLLAAPAIVRASSLMPVRVPRVDWGVALNSMAHPHNDVFVPDDFSTDSFIVVAHERYAVQSIDWRCIFGTFPT